MSTMDVSDGNRRDVLFIATAAVGTVGAAVSLWPMINQMNSESPVLALSPIESDLATVAEGQSVTIKRRVCHTLAAMSRPAECTPCRRSRPDKVGCSAYAASRWLALEQKPLSLLNSLGDRQHA